MTGIVEMGLLVFDVPLPYRALSPNSAQGRSRHWAYQAGQDSPRQTYKRDVAFAAMEALQKAPGWTVPKRARVSLVFGTKQDRRAERFQADEWKPYRPIDWPNAVSAAKPLFDGLVVAGVISDDNHEVLEGGSVVIRPDLGPGVTVTVERLE